MAITLPYLFQHTSVSCTSAVLCWQKATMVPCIPNTSVPLPCKKPCWQLAQVLLHCQTPTGTVRGTSSKNVLSRCMMTILVTWLGVARSTKWNYVFLSSSGKMQQFVYGCSLQNSDLGESLWRCPLSRQWMFSFIQVILRVEQVGIGQLDLFLWSFKIS